MSGRRVVITGIGVVSPIGCDLESFWRSLAQGRSGIRRLPPEVAASGGVQVAAPIDWDPTAHFRGPEAAALDRVSQFSLVAAGQALAAARFDPAQADRDRVGVYWGTGLGGANTLETAYAQIYGRGDYRLRPLTVVMAMNNAGGSNVALRWGLRGPFANFSTACSSSAMALGEAMRAIREGRADAIVAGGAEALLTPGTLAAWLAVRTLAPADAADAAASCRPFHRRRAGLVLGEGAAAFLLEDEARARRRGAPVLARLTGYGNTCDAMHLSKPDRDGQVRAMRAALADARLAPQAIGYVNAHGTATVVGDPIECEAIRAALGEAAERVPVSSTKSMHGHLIGAAGALELAAALLAICKGLLPPTAFLDDPDPACAVRHVACAAEPAEAPQAVMSNSFAFGGSNVVLIAERA
ncbi:MAG: beta-ketoacyl-[acyl-carrier-protein] synthase family protein [Burkholderiales bacterium]|nr:beta-ketoacyl-[acyl-carrier-protein] synthase family protein [Burkholderiales bacterium]